MDSEASTAFTLRKETTQTSGAPDFTLAMAKARYDHSKAKNLIYGLDASVPPTPDCRATRSMNVQRHETPFATFETEPSSVYPKSYTRRADKNGAYDKIGANRGFDPNIYITNLQRNSNNQRNSRLRNFEGSGKILAHEGKTSEPPPEECVSEAGRLSLLESDS
ncbi:hypothetical protein BSKO_00856 [Bryopsis sp. KO-2023]|nr:hypothetical protein BSKO_00856 [Bryopsis sp. KO-2023]